MTFTKTLLTRNQVYQTLFTAKVKSKSEKDFIEQLWAANAPAPRKEYRFTQKRLFKADFAWPEIKLIVEIEGGTRGGKQIKCNHCKQPVSFWANRMKRWIPVKLGGRHNRAEGYEKDCEKYNLALIDGWKVLRFTTNQVKNRTAINTTIRAIKLWKRKTSQ